MPKAAKTETSIVCHINSSLFRIVMFLQYPMKRKAIVLLNRPGILKYMNKKKNPQGSLFYSFIKSGKFSPLPSSLSLFLASMMLPPIY